MSADHAANSAGKPLPMPSLEPLLAGLVDYAGTFPPAGFDVPTACAAFARARGGSAAWIASRFAVALGDVPAVDAWLERRGSANDDSGRDREPWPITVVVGANSAGAAAVREAASTRVALAAYECRAASADDVAAAADALLPLVAAPTDVVVEVPAADAAAWPALLDAIAARGLRAKLRTGSVRPEEIPSAAALARFLAACAERGLALKLTAGLHRALRAERDLTYEAGGPRAPLHGFVNAYAAAGLAFFAGADAAALERCLACTDVAAFEANAFEATDQGLVVRAHGDTFTLTTDHLRELRADRIGAFGSCSFDEPIEDLIALGWLPPTAAAVERDAAHPDTAHRDA